jgi:hypothetical protein
MTRRFATPEAFRRSLEERLKRRALTAGRTLERERQLVVFERFLARLFVQPQSDLVVKGGLALELRTDPRVTHIAEKLHAYTLPRPSLNSRVKDLPDIAILASIGSMECEALRTGLERTFVHRATHALPSALPVPPREWNAPYERMAMMDNLRWKRLDEAHAAAASFIDSSLRAEQGQWAPAAWAWLKPLS